jgi:hypothetical protein
MATAEIRVSRYRSVEFFPREKRIRPEIPILSDIAKATIVAAEYF